MMIDAPAQTPAVPGNANRHFTYQKQYRTCGKVTCGTCARGPGHGPYWYAYYRDGSKVKSIYLGNHDPHGRGVASALADLEAERERKRQAREAKKSPVADSNAS